MKFNEDYTEYRILKEKFIALLKLRINRNLETLQPHVTDKKVFKNLIREAQRVINLKEAVYILGSLLCKLKTYPPYNEIPDWSNNPVILVDIDATLFEKEGDVCIDMHCFGEPVAHVVQIVNELYDLGCCIKIFTGRMNLYVYGIDKSIKYSLQKALKRAGVKYHEILEIPKPNAEVILDDLAINPLL